MPELILAVFVIGILIGANLLVQRIKSPAAFYIRLVAFIILMGLLWGIDPLEKVPIKTIITSLVLFGLYKEFLTSKRFNKKSPLK